MKFTLEEVDSSWRSFFTTHLEEINGIVGSIDGEAMAPERSKVFRAFQYPLNEVKVLIVGQDPYPGFGIADGLAFSSARGNPIPASLKNIYKELESDLGILAPSSPDLSHWSDRGVMLLNRTLTTSIGARNAHVESGWREITLAVAEMLASQNVVAILWGKYAQELSPLFPHRIESVHPSPLSAYRGFFGSRPFSRANDLLIQMGREPVDWNLR